MRTRTLSAGLRLAFLLVLSLVGTACSGRSPGTTGTPRAATQTPWIVYISVTTTPEPATVTPLPTITVRPKATATRAAPKVVVAPTKPPPTQAPPTVVVPSATSAPACPQTVSLQSSDPVREPGMGALRRTPTSDTFRFKFTPFSGGPSDPKMGYEIDMSAKRGTFSNGASLYFSHNWFLQNGNVVVFDRQGVAGLAGGDSIIVNWNVRVVYAPSGFNDNNPTERPANLVDCGASNPVWTIDLQYVGS